LCCILDPVIRFSQMVHSIEKDAFLMLCTVPSKGGTFAEHWSSFGHLSSLISSHLYFSEIIIIIISKTMFMVLSSWQSHGETSCGSFDECRMAPSGRRPKTKPDDLGCESACTGCQNLHPPSPFIIIAQPESWYSFYRPTEGRRLSRPSWLVTYRDGLPVHRRSPILVLTGSDVAQLRWSRPTRYH